MAPVTAFLFLALIALPQVLAEPICYSPPPPPQVLVEPPCYSPPSPPPPCPVTAVDELTFNPAERQVSIIPDQDGPVLNAIEQDVLNGHNGFRASHGASPLTWDNTLVNFAKNQAAKCVFKHSGGPYGGASSYGPSLLVEGTHLLQRTWLLELALSASPKGSTCGRMKPRIITPKVPEPRTSPRSFGRAPRVLDASLLLALPAPSFPKALECVTLRRATFIR